MSLPRDPDVQISRVPSKPLRREDDGAIAVDLWVCREGVFESDVTLRLTAAEAEVLHAQLCYALDAEPATTPANRTPDCRKPSVGSSGVHWP